MKLRNKKTGEIKEFGYISLGDKYFNGFNSLAELNKEWEDYKENSLEERVQMLEFKVGVLRVELEKLERIKDNETTQ